MSKLLLLTCVALSLSLSLAKAGDPVFQSFGIDRKAAAYRFLRFRGI